VGDPQWQDLVDTQMAKLFAAYGGENYSCKINWFGTRAGNHYLYKDYFGFARRKENNEVWDTGLGVSFIRELPDAASLLASADFYYGDKNYPVTGTAQGHAGERDFSIKPNIMIDMPRIFRDDLSTEASLSYTWSRMRYGAVSRNDDQYLTAINRWGWYPLEKLTFRSGMDWRFIHVDSTEDGRRKGNNGGLYLTAEYRPVKNFLVLVSIKGVTDTTQGSAVPKAGFVWQVSERFTLKNNYFRSFKFPDFDDLFYHSADGLYTGNPELLPEDGAGADLTGEFSFGENFSAGLTAYTQWTTDSIHWVKHGARWTPENVGTGFFIGADVRPALSIPLSLGDVDKIKLSLHYQYQASWLLNGDLNFSHALRIPYMPMHIAGASIDIPWKTKSPEAGGSLLVSAHWESLRYADTLNRMELAPYCLLTLTLNQNIGKRFTAFAVLRNALNSLYTSFAEYPMPGINLTIGTRVNIGG
jgi:vitamin B12 transporter